MTLVGCGMLLLISAASPDAGVLKETESAVSKNEEPAVPKLRRPPPEDTARYLAWLKQRGTAITDTAREAVGLRVGDWGFFDHGSKPGEVRDRAALDRSGHVIAKAAIEKGDWHALLSTPGLDATGALNRIAFVYVGAPEEKSKQFPKITEPTLVIQPDGTVVFKGWLRQNFGMPGPPVQITIEATAAATKISFSRT